MMIVSLPEIEGKKEEMIKVGTFNLELVTQGRRGREMNQKRERERGR